MSDTREIIFKAKRKDNGEWTEGDVIHEPYGACIQYCDNKKRTKVVVIPDTICQYTGLTDKNGNKIWENDILECGMRLRVSWHHFKASWVLSKKGWMYNRFFGESVEPEDIEVIGNIFDNPELLEVE